ncbi:hypothetical protein [Pseudoalteromonas sp. FUC4]|uniref:hypothetical protein n=1 Tax=Pseudoalteromonas sp. FUC4 TaxID=2511201 RepID=UPI0021D198E1|nr:hypothetical protein [Pseudoalteromonas sp. FUC4]
MDDSIKQQVNQSTGEYLLFTLYWLAFFLLVLPISSNEILSLLDGGSLVFKSNPIYLFISTFLIAVLTLPFLKSTLDAQNKSDVIGRLAIKKWLFFL